jgi:hypothetical protein
MLNGLMANLVRSIILALGMFLVVATGNNAHALANNDGCVSQAAAVTQVVSAHAHADAVGTTADECGEGSCSGVLTCHCFCHAHVSSLPVLMLALPQVRSPVLQFSQADYLTAISPIPPARPPKA